MFDTMMVVDQYQRYHDAREKGYRVDIVREAQQLGRWLQPFGDNHRRVAVVAREDKEGMQAYADANFLTVTLNGNRSAELNKVIADELRHLREHPPAQLVIVSADPTFDTLCAGLDNNHTKVSVWSPTGQIPQAFNRYDTLQLDELIQTRIDVDKWYVFLDYENVHIHLEKRGWYPRPKEIVDAIQLSAGDAKIETVIAYADWDMLTGNSKRNYQRELAELGIKTRYQINMRGKNSADMEIVSDIHTLLADSASIDVVAIASHDRDFRPVMEDIKKTPKKALALAFKEGISRELRTAADEVRYLDTYIKLNDAKRPQPPQAKRSKRIPQPNDPLAPFALQVAAWMNSRHWKWVYVDRLDQLVSESDRFTEEDIRVALDTGVLVESEEHPRKLLLNKNDALARVARQLAWWLPRRLDYCLNRRNMPYVDSKYLAVGMSRENEFQSLNVGQSRYSAENWLELAAVSGIVARRRQPHPSVPGVKITTWWLPGQAPDFETNPAESSVEPSESRKESKEPAEERETHHATSTGETQAAVGPPIVRPAYSLGTAAV